MNIYGYIRVSSTDQNEDRQIIALTAIDIPLKNIYVDKISGKNFNRPQYKKLLKKLRRATLSTFSASIVSAATMKKPRTNGTFIAVLVLQILSFVAQSE